MSKKNYNKIPPTIQSKVEKIEGKFFVAAVIRLSLEDVQKGKYKNMGIFYEKDPLSVKDTHLPSASAGKYSKKNKLGWIIVHKNRPMIKKTYSFESPNFGDWGKGSHTVSWDKDVYQRTRVEPPKTNISNELLEQNENEIILGVRVNNELDSSSPELNKDLLFSLNLLQENWGTVNILPIDKPIKELISYRRLDWEVLPPGWWHDKKRMESLAQTLGEKVAVELLDGRLRYLDSLKPLNAYEGISYLSGRAYYIFEFDSIIVAECPMFGNAVYILDGENRHNWKEIFTLSKNEALKAGAFRIPHHGSWKQKINNLVNKNGR